MRNLIYRIFGPTTQHLHLEWYLVLCLELLTASSLQGLYKQEWLGRTEDYYFLFFHALWLSKYWIMRVLCLWDPTTHATPSLQGFLALFVTSHVTGGQVFDRPQRKYLSKQVLAIAARDEDAYASLVPSIWSYQWQWYKMRAWLPLLRLLDRSSLQQQQQQQQQPPSSSSNSQQPRQRQSATKRASTTSAASSASASNQQSQQLTDSTTSSGGGGSGIHSNSILNLFPGLSSLTLPLRRHGGWIYQTLLRYSKILWRKGPTLQFLLPNVLSYIILYPVATRLRFSEPLQAPSALYNSGFSAHMKAEEARLKRYGAYAPFRLVTLADLFTIVMGLSLFVLCVSFFSRIFPPIPDQIAGGNVREDIRKDAKQKTTGSGKGGGGKGKHAASSAEPAHVWTERHCPISTENRTRVHRTVMLFRLLDIWICCGWLPRSDLLARALGHTSSKMHLPHRMSQDLYPMGMTRPLRPDTMFRFFEKQIRDPTSFLWHLFNLALLPVLLLGVQSLFLNRTYISISSYFAATEWTLIGPVEPGDVTSSMGSWDARKKYKKDDLVVHNDFLYQAAHAQPEGRPVEPDIRDWQEPTMYELGHPGTSDIITKAYAVQLVSTLVQAGWWLMAFFYRDRTPDGLMIAVIANLIASHALSCVGTTRYDELRIINQAIMGKKV